MPPPQQKNGRSNSPPRATPPTSSAASIGPSQRVASDGAAPLGSIQDGHRHIGSASSASPNHFMAPSPVRPPRKGFWQGRGAGNKGPEVSNATLGSTKSPKEANISFFKRVRGPSREVATDPGTCPSSPLADHSEAASSGTTSSPFRQPSLPRSGSTSNISEQRLRPKLTDRALGILEAMAARPLGNAFRSSRMQRSRSTLESLEPQNQLAQDDISPRREATVRNPPRWPRETLSEPDAQFQDLLAMSLAQQPQDASITSSARLAQDMRRPSPKGHEPSVSRSSTVDDSFRGPKYPSAREDRPYWLPASTSSNQLKPRSDFEDERCSSVLSASIIDRSDRMTASATSPDTSIDSANATRLSAVLQPRSRQSLQQLTGPAGQVAKSQRRSPPPPVAKPRAGWVDPLPSSPPPRGPSLSHRASDSTAAESDVSDGPSRIDPEYTKRVSNLRSSGMTMGPVANDESLESPESLRESEHDSRDEPEAQVMHAAVEHDDAGKPVLKWSIRVQTKRWSKTLSGELALEGKVPIQVPTQEASQRLNELRPRLSGQQPARLRSFALSAAGERSHPPSRQATLRMRIPSAASSVALASGASLPMSQSAPSMTSVGADMLSSSQRSFPSRLRLSPSLTFDAPPPPSFGYTRSAFVFDSSRARTLSSSTVRASRSLGLRQASSSTLKLKAESKNSGESHGPRKQH